MNVQEYVREDGSNPYRNWFDSLDEMAATKVAIVEARLALGNTSNVKWFDGIGEYRIDWGPGYRVYLVQDGQDLIVLFGGGTKKRQQADIQQALLLRQEYQQRKQQALEAESGQPVPPGKSKRKSRRSK
ncbi:MAG: type II toxin-antitoxin system RelE/ParE family toxin [Alkalinema sp. RU_4_3]|nr:type II toxin-antitoxin system RelE/ParE family toxin [Alkalinema sp. RU_4_3]